MNKSLLIFGIKFIDANYKDIIFRLNQGAFMIIPSAPGLSTIFKDERYARAVKHADFAIPDSGYMILLLRLFKKIKVKKYSGYSFLKDFFNINEFKKDDLFLIDPNNKESIINNKYLNRIGIPIDLNYHYAAPIYGDGKIIDEALINILKGLDKKPKYLMINLGSNIQEPLGFYLKNELEFNVGILCSGAAISFFTGSQAPISATIDRFGLGWLRRCIESPFKYIPRYLKAFSLINLIIKEEVINITK